MIGNKLILISDFQSGLLTLQMEKICLVIFGTPSVNVFRDKKNIFVAPQISSDLSSPDNSQFPKIKTELHLGTDDNMLQAMMNYQKTVSLEVFHNFSREKTKYLSICNFPKEQLSKG